MAQVRYSVFLAILYTKVDDIPQTVNRRRYLLLSSYQIYSSPDKIYPRHAMHLLLDSTTRADESHARKAPGWRPLTQYIGGSGVRSLRQARLCRCKVIDSVVYSGSMAWPERENLPLPKQSPITSTELTSSVHLFSVLAMMPNAAISACYSPP